MILGQVPTLLEALEDIFPLLFRFGDRLKVIAVSV